MNLQDLERDPDLRIKFASIDEHGVNIGDADCEYDCFFTTLPQGWNAEVAEQVQTRSEGPRPARRLAHDGTELGAVQHETGVEFLVALAGGTASSVASAAIIGFSTWAWSRWQELRASKPLAPSLVLEGVVARSLTGQPLVTTRQELRGPLSADAVGKSIENFLQRRTEIDLDRTTNRGTKLAVVAIALAAVETITVYLLLENGDSLIQPVTVFGTATLLYKPWVLAVLGGIFGGTTRALYAFLVQTRAFETKRVTGHSSSHRSVTVRGNVVEDDFDWMHVWYLYLIKPLIGGAMGFLFALLIGFGLVPFLAQNAQNTQTFG
ncbi:MAG TPA: hypothetical protein VF982_00925, partial [Anaerolineales bacterium]